MNSCAVVITGPDWWGDSSMTRAGVPVDYENREEARERLAEANAEMFAVDEPLVRLPVGTLVMCDNGHSCSSRVGMQAQRMGFPIAVIAVGERLPIMSMLEGLAAADWRVKVIHFTEPGLVAEIETRVLEAAQEAEIWITKIGVNGSIA